MSGWLSLRSGTSEVTDSDGVGHVSQSSYKTLHTLSNGQRILPRPIGICTVQPCRFLKGSVESKLDAGTSGRMTLRFEDGTHMRETTYAHGGRDMAYRDIWRRMCKEIMFRRG